MYDIYSKSEVEFRKLLYTELSDLVVNNKLIYKYMDFEIGVKTLNNQTIAFSSPLEVNDPYDCYLPLIDYKNIPIEYIQYIIKTYPTHFDRDTREKLLTQTSEDIYNMMKDILDKGWRNDLSKRRISCFSETFSNLLMWSHYGKSHSGICIGFDLGILYESIRSSSDSERLLIKVNYSKDFVSMDYYEHPWESVINWLRTKSIDWEYEKEIRMILYDLEFEKNLQIKLIDSSSFVSVFLGSKISKENEDRIQLIINEKLPKVIIKKMILSNNKFEVVPI